MLTPEAVILMVIGGGCTGLGSAIGNYFAQRAFIRHLEKMTSSQINPAKAGGIPHGNEV